MAVMHTEITDAEVRKHREKAAAEANGRMAHRFEVGDLVMCTVAKTSVNATNKSKPRMRWQGPLQVISVADDEPSTTYVRLLGDPDTIAPKPVHWTRLKRFAGKEFTITPQLSNKVGTA